MIDQALYTTISQRHQTSDYRISEAASTCAGVPPLKTTIFWEGSGLGCHDSSSFSHYLASADAGHWTLMAQEPGPMAKCLNLYTEYLEGRESDRLVLVHLAGAIPRSFAPCFFWFHTAQLSRHDSPHVYYLSQLDKGCCYQVFVWGSSGTLLHIYWLTALDRGMACLVLNIWGMTL